MLDISRRNLLKGIGLGTTAAVVGDLSAEERELIEDVRAQMKSTTGSVVADPTDIPDPIDRYEPKTHDVTIEAQEVTAEIEPGVEF
ncbi:MAG: twin-arginine translocation signal domain-containing protein, partial [Halobacteria archaeon]|nr:twin-arginine translocation signal domain-containing protein [Halobacteria archaeon]